MMLAGLLLIAAALFLGGYSLWDEWRAAVSAEQILLQMPEPEMPKPDIHPEELEIPDYILNPDMEMPTVEIDGNTYIGTLELPTLELSLPVMSSWGDSKLKIAPCRYEGSAYTNNLVIAGHNYRKHFSKLQALSAGDPVTFTDVDGNCFCYRVAEVEVLQATAIQEMVESGWDLTLFTCTYGGQTRLTIRCEAEEPSNN